MQVVLVLIFCILGFSLAHESYLGNSQHPDHPGKCYHNETQKVFEVDEVFQPVGGQYCQKFTCMKEYVIRVDWCQKYNVPSNCVEVPGDLSLPYPDCCKHLRCIDDGKEEIRKTSWDE